jgi:FkbM family methyltransferase
VTRSLPPFIAQRIRHFILHEALAHQLELDVSGQSITGSFWTGKINDRCSYPFSVHGYYDWRRLAIALAVSCKGDCIVEIGGNIGTETLGFSDIVGSSGKVFTFEPLPSNIIVLGQTLSQAQNKNVTVFPLAVSDVCTNLLFSPPAGSLSITGHITYGAATLNEIEVKSVTLDSMLAEIPVTRIIFSDAEGHEGRVIAGAKSLIARDRPFLVLEASPLTLPRAGDTIEKLFMDLQSMKYLIFQIERFGLRHLQYTEQISQHVEGNWFCCPIEKKDLLSKVNRSIVRCGSMPCVRGLNPLVLGRVHR